jgi:hypothetical protein
MVVDPPNGRVPLKREAVEARNALFAQPSNSLERYGPWERCITRGVPNSMMPGAYNNGHQIVQTPDYVVVHSEMIHEARVIPLDGRPHPGPDVRSWNGDSRGHWEGDTLVVETTNLRPDHTYRNGDPNTERITEYFTRIDANTIEYKFTVNDPRTWTKPWSAIIPMSASTGPRFEYDCSEDNNDAVNILAGARAFEKKAGEGKTQTPISQK